MCCFKEKQGSLSYRLLAFGFINIISAPLHLPGLHNYKIKVQAFLIDHCDVNLARSKSVKALYNFSFAEQFSAKSQTKCQKRAAGGGEMN